MVLILSPAPVSPLPRLGASGAVSCLLMTSIALFPNQQILLYMLFPMPAYVFAFLYLGYEMYGSYMGGRNIGAFL